MTSSVSRTALVLVSGVLLLTAADAVAARAWRKAGAPGPGELLRQAREREITGDYYESHKLYSEVADGCRNSDTEKRFRAQADRLAKAAEETISGVKAVANMKSADQSAIVQALRDCWPIVLGWRGHKYGNAANSYFSKLKKKLKSDTKREAEEEAKDLAKAAYEALKAKNHQEALRTYQQLYEQYPFTKEASKRVRTYLDLRASVELSAEDLRDMRRQKRRGNRRKQKGEE